MNRTISLTLTLVAALASQFALSGCSKHEPVTTDTAASAPDLAASSSMSAGSAPPMDSISSASAMSGADAASAPATSASN